MASSGRFAEKFPTAHPLLREGGEAGHGAPEAPAETSASCVLAAQTGGPPRPRRNLRRTRLPCPCPRLLSAAWTPANAKIIPMPQVSHEPYERSSLGHVPALTGVFWCT